MFTKRSQFFRQMSKKIETDFPLQKRHISSNCLSEHVECSSQATAETFAKRLEVLFSKSAENKEYLTLNSIHSLQSDPLEM